MRFFADTSGFICHIFLDKVNQSKSSLAGLDRERALIAKQYEDLIANTSEFSKYGGIYDIDLAAKAVSQQAEKILASAK